MHPDRKLCRLIGSSPWITSLVLCHPSTPKKYLKEMKTMFSIKIGLAAAALAPVLLFGTSAATAQDSTHCFDLASLQGKYGIVVTYLPTFAAVAIGTRSYDGAGNMTGTFIVNGPTAGSTTGARTITKGTQVWFLHRQLRRHRRYHPHCYAGDRPNRDLRGRLRHHSGG